MEKTRKSGISEVIKVPKEITIKVDKGIVSVKGKDGENKKDLFNKKVKIEVKDNSIMITSAKSSKREKKMVCTFKSHIKNLIKAASEGSIYTLKICSGHFPMNVSTEKNEFVVKNFLGEKIPRKMKIKAGVDIKIEGDIITVKSSNKESSGQVAASIEQLTRRTKYDHRVFMDGIWITNKDGKEMK